MILFDFKQKNGFDAYGRPTLNLGHCHFKGGGTSTTIQKRDIPEQSALEAELEAKLGQYNQSGIDAANALQKEALEYINQTYNPNWQMLYDEYNGDIAAALADYQNTSDATLNAYTTALAQRENIFGEQSDQNLIDYRKLMNQALGTQTDERNLASGEYGSALTEAAQNYDLQQREDLNSYKNALSQAESTNQRDLSNALAKYDNTQQKNLNQYQNTLDTEKAKYDGSMSSALDEYSKGMASVNARAQELADGILPTSYNQNFQAAMKDDLNALYGSKISQLASRGIINSSVTNTAMDSISQSIADASAKNFIQSLSSASSLNNARASNLADTYNTKAGNAKDTFSVGSGIADSIYKAAQGSADSIYNASVANAKDKYNNSVSNSKSIYDAANTVSGNRYNAATGIAKNKYDSAISNADTKYTNSVGTADNIYKSAQANTKSQYDNAIANAAAGYAAQTDLAKQLLQSKNEAAQNKFVGAAQAQAQSYYAPGTLLGYAQNLANSANNQYNTMYTGRMGTASTSTTTTQSSGSDDSIWGAAGTIGAALITCFVAGTKVAIRGGLKNIEDIKVGDEVLTLSENGGFTHRKVTKVSKPRVNDTISVRFANGATFVTTSSQRLLTYGGFEYIEKVTRPIITTQSNPTAILEMHTDKRQTVYDFTVEGNNIFFANGIGVEGDD